MKCHEHVHEPPIYHPFILFWFCFAATFRPSFSSKLWRTRTLHKMDTGSVSLPDIHKWPGNGEPSNKHGGKVGNG
jgi:hypothetical protein